MNRNLLKMWLLVFCVAAGMKYDINFGVRVPVGELMAFSSLPFLLFSVRLERYGSRLFVAVAVLALWACAVCISDLVNSIPLNFLIKGLAKPIWCGLWMLFFISVLSRDYRALYAYPAGLIIAGLQNYFLPQAWTEYYAGSGEYEAAAFALVPLVMPIITFLSLYIYRKFPLLASFIFFLGAFVFVYLGVPRSTVALCLLVFLTLGYMWSLKFRRIRVQKIPIGRVLLFGILFFCSSYLIFEVYVWIASNGWMGEMQRQKLESQSDTIFGNNLLGVILDGRTSVFAAILAIIDQPLTGFGSWQAKTLGSYYIDAMSLVGTNAAEYQMLSSGGSPGAGHSILFSAWTENGLLAAFALAIIGYWMFMELLNIVFRDNLFAPLLVSMGLFFFWSYFFSPFGVESRLVIGLFLALRITKFCKDSTKTKYAPLQRHKGAV